MKRTLLCRSAVVLSLAAVTCVPLAAQDAPTSLTLDEAISRTLANSLRLAELQAREEAADAVVNGRRADKMPLAAAQAAIRAPTTSRSSSSPSPCSCVR